MTDLFRVRSTWAGFPGAPGVTTMYFLDHATCVASVRTFWTDIAAHFPLDVHIQVQHTGDIIDDGTGDITGTWTSDAVAVVNGSSDNPYAAPVGACVNWITDTVVRGHRLRGRTFLVPMGNQDFQSDGSLNNTTRDTIQTAADNLIASQSSSFVVHSKGTGTDGTDGLIISATVPDKAVVLRSRRD